VIHSFWVPELAGTRDVVPGRVNTLNLAVDRGKEGTYLGQCKEYCGLSHANMRFRVIVQTRSAFEDWLAGQQGDPAVALSGRAQTLFFQKYGCATCHKIDGSNTPSYGPNLTHLASRSTFASGYYKLTKSQLVDWIMDAPSLIPMNSKECRIHPPGTPGSNCVGMPSFTKNTPSGQPTMTREDADTLANYLLSLK